jgi:type I restriction enzyme S subunit
MSWPLKPLSELCLLAVDCVNKTAPVEDGPTPYKMIRTTNVKGGFIDTRTVRYVSEATFESWTRRSKPQYGDVILTREAPVGEVGRCTFDETEQIFLGQRLFQYRPDPTLLDWNYLAYALQSPQVQNKLHGMSFGATVPHIKVGDAENLEIPYPPLETQRAIGGLLAAYDDLIENNQRRIALLEESARLLYEEWFVRMRCPGVNKGTSGIPAGWTYDHLSDLVTLNYGKALKDSDRKEGEVPVFGSSGIVGTHDVALVNGPALIVGRKGNVGSVFYSKTGCFPIDTVYFVGADQATFFNYFTLKAQSFVSSDTAVPGLNRNYAYALPVLLPSEDVLLQFEQMVSIIFQQRENLTHQCGRLVKARNELLPKFMSGELTV